ncbi:MAG: endo-1,4-beta-xylanase [Bacteroidota bacterium]|nr:endo-1,4-beta-xylanase [Bacteroidota bacterium]
MERSLKQQEAQRQKSSEDKTYSCSYLRIFSSSAQVISMLFFIFVFCYQQSFSQPLASNKTKFVGNIIGRAFHANFSQYWDQVTAENAGKWGSVEMSQGSYDFAHLDSIYHYALSNHFPYKHHTLIWGSQQPSFMSTLDSASQYQEIVKWIDTTGQRYPEADFCDVVNEPLHHPPSYKNVLGGSGATGWDWVIKAFELARKYWSPRTKLLINEYSVINGDTAGAKYLQIINVLKERGLIDGIGVQAHWFEVDGGASVTALKNNLDSLAATGLPIYISELDIDRQDDSTQLQRYQTIFPVLYEHPAVKGVTLWGYMQHETWRRFTYLVRADGSERPALQWLRKYLLTSH